MRHPVGDILGLDQSKPARGSTGAPFIADAIIIAITPTHSITNPNVYQHILRRSFNRLPLHCDFHFSPLILTALSIVAVIFAPSG